jgi:hypothetical protein
VEGDPLRLLERGEVSSVAGLSKDQVGTLMGCGENRAVLKFGICGVMMDNSLTWRGGIPCLCTVVIANKRIHMSTMSQTHKIDLTPNATRMYSRYIIRTSDPPYMPRIVQIGICR